MIRITTPMHTLTFPQDPSNYKGIRITYQQCGEIILQKTEEDMTFDSEHFTASYRLSQEETKMFKANEDVHIQAHVRDNEDNVFASDIIPMRVKDVIDNEEM